MADIYSGRMKGITTGLDAIASMDQNARANAETGIRMAGEVQKLTAEQKKQLAGNVFEDLASGRPAHPADVERMSGGYHRAAIPNPDGTVAWQRADGGVDTMDPDTAKKLTDMHMATRYPAGARYDLGQMGIDQRRDAAAAGIDLGRDKMEAQMQARRDALYQKQTFGEQTIALKKREIEDKIATRPTDRKLRVARDLFNNAAKAYRQANAAALTAHENMASPPAGSATPAVMRAVYEQAVKTADSAFQRMNDMADAADEAAQGPAEDATPAEISTHGATTPAATAPAAPSAPAEITPPPVAKAAQPAAAPASDPRVDALVSKARAWLSSPDATPAQKAQAQGILDKLALPR